MNILLTIAIPTFNRADYLDLNLKQLCAQMGECGDEVEILVSDNCSDDHTESIVEKYKKSGFKIKFIKNTENIGAERNFIQCFNRAEGKYILILGDDDLLLDNALVRIISFLKRGEYGLVRLFSYGYDRDFKAEMSQKIPLEGVSSDSNAFITKIGYFISYASGCIANRELLNETSGFRSDRFIGTNFPHVYWFLTAAIRAKINGCVGGMSIAAKRNNSGSYQLADIFARKLNQVFDWIATNEDISAAVFVKINNHLLLTFFPYFVLRQRAGLNRSFEVDKTFQTLFTVYRRNIRFWIFVAPLAILPRWCCKLIFYMGDYTYKNLIARRISH